MDDFFSAQKSGKGVDLEDVVDVSFAERVRALVVRGALVSVGTTRDGGALSLTITWDGSWRREYLTTKDDVDEFLDAALRYIEALGGRPPAPTNRRTRASATRGALNGS